MAASIGRLGGSTTDSSHPYSGQIPQFQTAHASSDLDPIYLELQQELSKLIHQESQIDQELIHNYSIIAQGKSILKGYSLSSLGGGISGGSGVSGGAGTGVGTGVYESSADITHHITHLQQYASNSSITDILLQDSKKLFLQIDDCSTLSDRLSALVRRLDLIQLHAQEALACTEDVINIKEYSIIISDAIQQNNIPTAVNYIQYIHQIDEQAVKASDDYQTIQDLTLQLKDLIKSQYEIAIQQNRIDDVLKLCPYLHVVGLETDATEKFLNFIESTIFIGITASISIENHATSPGQPNQAAMYAEILSNIFNTAFTICQQYLPVVIQGLERTYGDIFFIRRLHAKCEKEVDIVVKKYLSYRNVKSMITSLKAPTSNTSKSSSQTPGSSGNIPSSAELHSFLDEIALILQYCSSYSKYLKMLCDGAEHRIRDVSSSSPQAPTVSSASQTVVFKNPTQFEALQQELVNSYYIEGEQWLVKAAVHSFTKSLSQFTTGKVKALSLDIDGYFFVFQRCSQRAIATNNIHAACAILHILSDHLNTDILQQFSDSLNVVVTHAGNKMRDIMSKFLKSSAWYSGSEEQDEAANKSGYIPQGLHNALLFASTLSRELPGAGANPTESTASPGEGMWGIESHMEILNLLETCIRYSDRLRREITSTGRSVFGDITEQQSTTRQSKQPSSSDEMNKLQLCIEDFESCKESFTQVSTSTLLSSLLFPDSFLSSRPFVTPSQASLAKAKRS